MVNRFNPKDLVKQSGISPDEVLKTLEKIILDKKDLKEVKIRDVEINQLDIHNSISVYGNTGNGKIVLMKKIIHVPVNYEVSLRFSDRKITAEERDKQNYIGMLIKKLGGGKNFGGISPGREVVYRASYIIPKNIQTFLDNLDCLVHLENGLIVGDTLVKYYSYGD